MFREIFVSEAPFVPKFPFVPFDVESEIIPDYVIIAPYCES